LEYAIVRKAILIISLLLLGTATGFAAFQAENLRKLIITHNMDKARISVYPGEEFAIELRVESDNGLQWYLDGYNHKLLEYRGQVVQVPVEAVETVEQDPSFFGDRHAVRFNLRALSEGESQVRFLYYRPWEGPELAEKKFEVAIVVTP
jgi:predicted secreted protein